MRRVDILPRLRHALALAVISLLAVSGEIQAVPSSFQTFAIELVVSHNTPEPGISWDHATGIHAVVAIRPPCTSPAFVIAMTRLLDQAFCVQTMNTLKYDAPVYLAVTPILPRSQIDGPLPQG